MGNKPIEPPVITGWRTEPPNEPSIPRGKCRKRVRPSKRKRRNARKGRR